MAWENAVMGDPFVVIRDLIVGEICCRQSKSRRRDRLDFAYTFVSLVRTGTSPLVPFELPLLAFITIIDSIAS
jgi:hypothetical protein